MTNTDKVESPCKGICQLGPDEVCTGCFRSMREIIQWPDANRKARQAILRAAAQRQVGQAT